MQLGVSSYAFGWSVGVSGNRPPSPFTERDLVTYARRQGLHLVQFGDNITLAEFDISRLEALRADADEISHPIEIEIGGRGLTRENIERYIEVARILRATFVRFVIDREDYAPSPAQVVDILRAAHFPLANNGIVLGIENHDRFSARTLRLIIEEVASPYIGICLDTANSLGAGEGLEYVLGQLGPLTVNLHIKDFTIARVCYAMGFIVEGRPAGAGFLNVPKLLETITAHGRCRSAILETWTPPKELLADTLALERLWADQSIMYLKPMFSPS